MFPGHQRPETDPSNSQIPRKIRKNVICNVENTFNAHPFENGHLTTKVHYKSAALHSHSEYVCGIWIGTTIYYWMQSKHIDRYYEMCAAHRHIINVCNLFNKLPTN